MSNLNEVKEKETRIEINGKERSVKYDLNALAELEENFGTFEEWETALAKNSMKNLRKFLWIGLKHEDENLTEKEVGSAFTLSKLKGVGGLIRNALIDSMPEADESVEDGGDEEGKNVKSQSQK